MGRGIVIALALSLAANVFLGGFVAGKFAGHGYPRAFGFAHGEGKRLSDLPPAARDALQRAYASHQIIKDQRRDEMRALHEEFVSVLTAETFDREAAEAAVEKIAAADRSRRAEMARLIVGVADGLSTEDRQALARHVERRVKHRRRER